MSLFTKYLSIIQEAYGEKSKQKLNPIVKPDKSGRLTFTGKDVSRDVEEMNQFYGSGQYKPEYQSNLSPEEIENKLSKMKIAERGEDINKNQLITSPEDLLYKLRENPVLNSQQLETVYSNSSLSYAYLLHFKNKTKDITTDSKNKLEQSILSDATITIKYIVDVLGKRWKEKERKVYSIIQDIKETSENQSFSIDQILNSYELDHKQISKFKKLYPELEE